MTKAVSAGAALAAVLVALHMGLSHQASAHEMKVLSDQNVTGFTFPESVGCDADAKMLYVSEFGSELKPTQMDGKGRISKVSPDGKILEASFLPAAGQVLNKPKGIWIQDGRLWTTDIDSAWVFDLATKKGRKVALPGIKFANDPAVIGNALYVSDNRGDQLYRVEPADFLEAAGEPTVTVVWSGKGINPNGLYPARDGSLLMVGFKSKEEARGIYAMAPGADPKALSKDIGRLDGIYETNEGVLLVTDWNSGSLFGWSADGGMQTLASGFKGPADFCVIAEGEELTVAVPDLVGSNVRIIKLGEE